MAVITAAGVTIVQQGGAADGSVKEMVIAIKNVTAGDTFDCSTLPGAAAFVKVFGAIFISSTNRTATTTIAGVAGTVLTLAGVGIANDAGYLFIVGE